MFPCIGFLTLLSLRHLETDKLGAIIPAVAIAGNSESIWDMIAVVTITLEAAIGEIWKG